METYREWVEELAPPNKFRS